MYKQASKLKLRFYTIKGLLTVEQLWDLPLNTLDSLAVSLEAQYKSSGKKSFLVAKSKKGKELKLMFDIVLDILTTKLEDSETAQKAADTKEHNQKILALIKEKKEDELKGKSIEDLENMLK